MNNFSCQRDQLHRHPILGNGVPRRTNGIAALQVVRLELEDAGENVFHRDWTGRT